MEKTDSSLREGDKLGQWLGIDLRHYVNVLRKRWLAITLIALATIAATFVWTHRQPQIFEATVTIIIDPRAPQVLQNVQDVVELGTGSYWANREFYETQYRIIRSKDVVQLTIERLGLTHDATYPSKDIAPEAKAKLDYPASLMSQIRVLPVKDSRIANITVADRQADRAALIANAVAQAYIDRNLEQKVEGSQSAAVWLGDQVVALKDQLRRSELAVYEFRREKQLLDINLDNKQNMTNRNLETFNTKLADVRALRLQFDAERTLIAGAKDNIEKQETLPLVRQHPVVQQLRVDYFELKRQLADLETNYLEKNPKIVAVQRQLQSVERDYRGEIDKILKSFDNAYQALVEQEKGLMRTMAMEKRAAIELAKIEVEYRPLAREAAETEKLYELVTTRQKETNLTGLIRNNNVRILDRAKAIPVPVSPRMVLNLILASLLGLGLGAAMAFLVEALDNTVKSQEEAEATLGVPVLGMVPIIGDKPGRQVDAAKMAERDLTVLVDPKSSTAEACRSIRTNIMFLSPEKALKTFVVTSPGPQEGKTTTAVSLAITMAQAGSRVLLVDTDLRRPRIHKVFGLTNDLGIANLIVESRTFESVTRKTDVPNLDVMTSGPHPPNPAELLHTKRFTDIIAEGSRLYDRVIFDSPPISAVTDPAIVGNLTDGVILVLRAGYTTRDAAMFARRQLTDAKARILGAIVNRVDLADSTYNNYYYRYYRSYRYGYSDNQSKA